MSQHFAEKKAQLEWQIAMGADEALAETPGTFANKKPSSAPQPNIPPAEMEMGGFAEPAAATKPVAPLAAPLAAEQEAREIADNCTSLEQLREAVSNFDGLAIKKTATNTVFSDGNPEAEIMFIGEAPGANEDAQGIPFCGASGQLMDKILGFAGITRAKNFYITNTLFWRPPGNRKPTPEELAICKPLVQRHIALINPKLLVLVGGTATFGILETKTGITKLRGKIHEYNQNPYVTSSIPAFAVFHPSFLLRQPLQKRTFWQDVLTIKKFACDNNITV